MPGWEFGAGGGAVVGFVGGPKGAAIGGGVGGIGGAAIEFMFDDEYNWSFDWSFKVCCKCTSSGDFEAEVTDLGQSNEQFSSNDSEYSTSYQ